MSDWDQLIKRVKLEEDTIDSQIMRNEPADLTQLRNLLSQLSDTATTPSQVRILQRHNQILKEFERGDTPEPIDHILEIANETRDSLVQQQSLLRNSAVKAKSLSERFPQVRNVLRKIRWKKRRDAILVGILIAMLVIVFFLSYTRQQK